MRKNNRRNGVQVAKLSFHKKVTSQNTCGQNAVIRTADATDVQKLGSINVCKLRAPPGLATRNIIIHVLSVTKLYPVIHAMVVWVGDTRSSTTKHYVAFSLQFAMGKEKSRMDDRAAHLPIKHHDIRNCREGCVGSDAPGGCKRPQNSKRGNRTGTTGGL